MREYGQISAKTLGKMRRNTHEGAQPKNFKSPLLRRFIYSLLFKAKGTRVMLGGHKKYSKSVMRLSTQSENKRKITLTLKTIKSAIRTSNIARTTII